MQIGKYKINKVYLGADSVDSIYLGDTQVFKDYSKDYLQLIVKHSGYIVWHLSGLTAEYKLNNGEWLQMDENTQINVQEGDVVRFKGTNESYGRNKPETGRHFDFGNSCEFDIAGNIMSLEYGDNFIGKTTLEDNYSFEQLFNGCLNTIDASNLILPAASVTLSAYYRLFQNCRALKYPPVLPATVIGPGAYSGLFTECNSLEIAPKLPATQIEYNCYQDMFYNTALKEAPALPATVLAKECYRNMFGYCTQLVKAPELPALTVPDGAYYSMFGNCSSLAQAPELPATTVGVESYRNLFVGCGLTKAPELPATNLANSCYYQIFANNANLTEGPSSLPATTLAPGCYRGMFASCGNLTKAPELHAKTLVSNCYYRLFRNCSSLNRIVCLAEEGFDANTALTSFTEGVAASGTFVKSANATGWTTGINGIPANWTVEDAS